MSQTFASTLPTKRQISLDDYFSQVVDDNPFVANRVSEPTGNAVDVAGIHHKAFLALTQYAMSSPKQTHGTGLVLWGDAGIGKSHLLRRLCQWAEKDQKAVYVFLHNIQANPESLPHYLTRCVVSRLTNCKIRDLHQTPLYRLMEGVVASALRRRNFERGRKASYADAEDAFEAIVDELVAENAGRTHPDDRAIYKVLFSFFLAAYQARSNPGPHSNEIALIAIRWLSGDPIDPEDAAKLSLGALARHAVPDKSPDNQVAERILFVLSELARCRQQPVILCLDQVENLEAEQFASLSRFVHSLLDATRNFMVVTSGLQESILGFLDIGAMTNAAWDRISQHKVLLEMIKKEEARQIIEARLEAFHTPFVTQAEIKQQVTRDTLFPLGKDWLRERLGSGVEFRPRDIVNWASDRWQSNQFAIQSRSGPLWLKDWPVIGPDSTIELPPIEAVIDAKIDKKIDEQIHRRQLDPAGLPPDSNNLLGLVLALLKQCLNREADYTIRDIRIASAPKGQKPAVDLIVEEAERGSEEQKRTGIKFIVSGSAHSNFFAIERLHMAQDKHDHLLLVTDRRRGIPLGDKGKDVLRRLTELGPHRFQHFDLELREIAELDALLSVSGDARSRDLEIEHPLGTTRSLSEADVVASHHRQDRFRKHTLLCELLTEAPAPTPPETLCDQIDEAQMGTFILHELSLAMGTTTVHLANRFRANSNRPENSEVFLPCVEKVVLKLHDEGKLHATPQDKHYFCVYMGCV